MAFWRDDGYPAPAPVSKNKARKRRRFILNASRKLSKRLRDRRDAMILEVFRDVRAA